MKMIFACLLVVSICFSSKALASTIEEKYEGKCALCHTPIEATSEECSRIDNCPCSFHAQCLKAFRGEN